MKRVMLLLLLTLLLLNACKKDSVKELDYYVYAEKSDNTIFKAIASSAGFKSLSAKDTLYIGANSGEDHLLIRLIVKKPGVYKSPNLDAILITTIGQDVIGNTYHLNNDTRNMLDITNIDNGLIQGTFGLSFKETTKGLTIAPSTVIFSNGRIRSQIGNNRMDIESFFQKY